MTDRPLDTHSWCSGERWDWREIWGLGWDLKLHDLVRLAKDCADRREKRALESPGTLDV